MSDLVDSGWPRTTIKESSYLKGRIGWQGLKASEFTDHGPYLITGTDFHDGSIDWSSCYHVTEERFKEGAYIHVRNGDLLITKDGTIGKIAHVTSCPPKAVLNSGIFLLRCSNGSYEHRFLYHLLKSDVFDTFLRLNLAGSTINHLYQNVFERFVFPVPDSKLQRRFVRILDSIDGQIEQAEALIAKYQQIKAGLMHDLFTRGVTPDGHLRPTRVQAPHLYRESPLGWIPKEWEVRRLGVILKECGGYFQTGPFGSQLHAYEYQHEGVPVVMPQDINDGIVSTEQIARISERRAEDLMRHRMKTGDIVIARRGDLSRASVITDREETWLCGTGCFLLRLGRSTLHGDFAALVYRHDVVQRQIAGMAVGTTMPSLNNNVMERLLFPYCDPNEQSRITERIGSLDQSLRLAQRHLANSTQVKHGLMQDLLTGRVRVKVGEAEEKR
jgi:type I restriction enzyme S subunit